MRTRGLRTPLLLASALMCLGLLVSPSITRAAPGSEWHNRDDKGHFFRLDDPDLVWREYQNGKAVYQFQVAGRNASSITLADPSRDVTVELGVNRAVVMQGGAVRFTIPGAWKRFSWMHSGGSFSRRANNTWIERQDGRDVYVFQVVSHGPDEVTLIDLQRNVKVHVQSSAADVYQNGKFMFRYTGGWIQ